MKFLQCHDVALSERNSDCSDEASFNDLTGGSNAVASRTGCMYVVSQLETGFGLFYDRLHGD